MLTATKPPAGRLVLVNGFDASVETSNGAFALSSQLYPPNIIHPDGASRIVEFTHEPWPKWTFALEDGTKIDQELFAVHGSSMVALCWRLANSSAKATLTVRPFVSGRDYHSLHHQNPAFQFHPEISDKRLVWHPYRDIPLPRALIEGEQAKQIVDAVERRLWTPLGLRSLAPDEPGYIAHYQGGVRECHGAYHQGTVWPCLISPFVEAWVRVRGDTSKAGREARPRFLAPLLDHLNHASLRHLSEIADADPPQRPRGCPFQAWSLAELIRLDRVVLAEETNTRWSAGVME